MLNPWENNPNKDLDILGIQVFMEELVLNPNKYGNINDALHSAINFARVFITNLNLQNSLPAANVWNAEKLIGEFSSNPYAYEFGQLLIRHNALGESNDPTSLTLAIKFLKFLVVETIFLIQITSMILLINPCNRELNITAKPSMVICLALELQNQF